MLRKNRLATARAAVFNRFIITFNVLHQPWECRERRDPSAGTTVRAAAVAGERIRPERRCNSYRR